MYDGRQPATHPNDLGRFFGERANAGDLDGLVALYEPDALLVLPGGRVLTGHDEIRAEFATMLGGQTDFEPGEQRPALVKDGVALTSTRLAGGGVTAEVARQQPDGRWLWAVDHAAINE